MNPPPKAMSHKGSIAWTLPACAPGRNRVVRSANQQIRNRMILLIFVVIASGFTESVAALEVSRLVAALDQASQSMVPGDDARDTEQTAAGAPVQPVDATRQDISAAAYLDLARAQLESGKVDQAISSLHISLELLEATEPLGSGKLVAPLTELASAYATLGAHADAIAAATRAISIERRSKGLFATGQLVLLDRLAGSNAAIGDVDGVDYARRYAVRIVEHEFGASDPRVIPHLKQLASWLELTGRYAMAIELYKRIAGIAGQESDGRSISTVDALIGIGRGHRLMYVETPELVENVTWGIPPTERFDPVTGQRQAIAGAVSRPGLGSVANPDPQGEDALLGALEILGSVPDPPSDVLAQTLLEIGDWYQTESSPERAVGYYQRAWELLEQAEDPPATNPLRAPRPIFYRPPADLRRNLALRHGAASQRTAEFRMNIGVRGEVSDLVRTGGDMTEGEGWQIARALRRAIFSPRFEAGVPVATTDFVLIETRYLPAPADDAATNVSDGAPDSGDPRERGGS